LISVRELVLTSCHGPPPRDPARKNRAQEKTGSFRSG